MQKILRLYLSCSNVIARHYFKMLCIITVIFTSLSDVSPETMKMSAKKVGGPEILWKVHSLEERWEGIKYIDRGDCIKNVCLSYFCSHLLCMHFIFYAQEKKIY